MLDTLVSGLVETCAVKVQLGRALYKFLGSPLMKLKEKSQHRTITARDMEIVLIVSQS